MMKLRTGAMVGALLLNLSSCSWFGCRCLPLCVEDARTQTTQPAAVDVYAVSSEQDRNRAAVTPVEEYFRTVGLPSRPGDVWHCTAEAGKPSPLLLQHPQYRRWRDGEPVALVAVTPFPKRREATCADPRRLIFSPSRSSYPSGTRSLHIRLTDGGLELLPSPRKLNPQPAS